jgi:hypothetical protein
VDSSLGDSFADALLPLPGHDTGVWRRSSLQVRSMSPTGNSGGAVSSGGDGGIGMTTSVTM